MEVIQLLEMCQKNYVNVKKAFYKNGLINLRDGAKPLKAKTEEEVFAYLMNWIGNQMANHEEVVIRHRVEEATYQMRFPYQQRHSRVTVPKLVSTDKDFILYEWKDDDILNELTAEKINTSVQRAEVRNNLEDMAWVNESCPNLTEEDLKLIEEILEV